MTKVKLSREGFEEALANATESDAPSVWHQDLLEHDANQRRLARIGAAVLERVDENGVVQGEPFCECPACGHGHFEGAGQRPREKYHADECPLTRYLEATDE